MCEKLLRTVNRTIARPNAKVQLLALSQTLYLVWQAIKHCRKELCCAAGMCTAISQFRLLRAYIVVERLGSHAVNMSYAVLLACSLQSHSSACCAPTLYRHALESTNASLVMHSDIPRTPAWHACRQGKAQFVDHTTVHSTQVRDKILAMIEDYARSLGHLPTFKDTYESLVVGGQRASW
eukprot:540728-Pelagomonas_calceolata.AAC.2